MTTPTPAQPTAATKTIARHARTTARRRVLAWWRTTAKAVSANAADIAAMPERDSVRTSDNAINAAAAVSNSRRFAAGEENQITRARQWGATPRISRARPAHNNPSVSGSPISIQPAKWFRLTNGPNGMPFSSGVQNP